MTRKSGFTLIELLIVIVIVIVIVIIAVLATITVVAYNGLSTRAEDSVIAAKVRSIATLIELYGASTGGLVPATNWSCIGEPEDFPTENGYTSEWCQQPITPAPIPGGADHPIDLAALSELKTITNRIPNGRLPEVDLGNGLKYRGMLYDSNAGVNSGKPVLQYYVKGNRTTCPIGDKEYSTSTYTRCNYKFKSVTSETGG